jgi:hypothetical protein
MNRGIAARVEPGCLLHDCSDGVHALSIGWRFQTLYRAAREFCTYLEIRRKFNFVVTVRILSWRSAVKYGDLQGQSLVPISRKQ